MTELDERLAIVVEMAPQSPIIADIGTDHGYTGIALLLAGKAGKLIFNDISEVSLDKARDNAEKAGVSGKAVFCAGDGFDALPEKPDAAIIAGMGADTIIDILSSPAFEKYRPILILQPNVGSEQLRRYLSNIGYRISDEAVARAGGRHYVIIKAEPGECQYEEADYIIGPILRKTEKKNFDTFIAFRIRVCEKALSGAMAGNDPGSIREITRELDEWRKIRIERSGDL